MFASAPTGAGGYSKTIYSGPLAGTILWNPSQDELYSTGSQRNTHIGVYICFEGLAAKPFRREKNTHLCSCVVWPRYIWNMKLNIMLIQHLKRYNYFKKLGSWHISRLVWFLVYWLGFSKCVSGWCFNNNDSRTQDGFKNSNITTSTSQQSACLIGTHLVSHSQIGCAYARALAETIYRVAPIYDDELPSTVALKKTYKGIFLWEFDFKVWQEKNTHTCVFLCDVWPRYAERNSSKWNIIFINSTSKK